MLFKELQFSKALYPIPVTDKGNVIPVKPEHPLNASELIVAKPLLLGRVTFERA